MKISANGEHLFHQNTKITKMPHERCETGAVLCRNFPKFFKMGLK